MLKHNLRIIVLGSAFRVVPIVDWLQDFSHFVAVTFANRDHPVASQEEIEIGGGEVSIRREIDRFQHGEDVAVVLLDFGALIAIPAVLDVERMNLVLSSEPVEFRILGVDDVMPFH